MLNLPTSQCLCIPMSVILWNKSCQKTTTKTKVVQELQQIYVQTNSLLEAVKNISSEQKDGLGS